MSNYITFMTNDSYIGYYEKEKSKSTSYNEFLYIMVYVYMYIHPLYANRNLIWINNIYENTKKHIEKLVLITFIEITCIIQYDFLGQICF